MPRALLLTTLVVSTLALLVSGWTAWGLHRSQSPERIIEARGLSSAASAANAAIDHVRDWVLGTNGKIVTMGIPSNGEYGIPKDVMFGFPVTTENGKYKIVEGLEIDEYSQGKIKITLDELEGERAGVQHLL